MRVWLLLSVDQLEQLLRVDCPRAKGTSGAVPVSIARASTNLAIVDSII